MTVSPGGRRLKTVVEQDSIKSLHDWWWWWRWRLLLLRCSVSHEKRVKELTQQLRERDQQHDSAAQQIAELKLHVKIVEDSRDSAKHDLTEAADSIRRGISTRVEPELAFTPNN